MLIHFLVAADADEPGVVTARQFTLFDAAKMDMTGDHEMGAVLMPDRLSLQPVKRRVHRPAFEIVRGVDPADFLIWEDEFDLRLPVMNGNLNMRGAHAADNLAAFVPFIMVTQDDR
jgi:hypothetical protein